MSLNRTLATCAAVLSLAVGCAKNPQTLKRNYVTSGDKYAAAGKINEAIVQYGNAIKQDPRDGDVRVKLANALTKSGNVRLAAGEYVRAADLLPKDASIQIKAGGLLLLTGQFDDARARAERALALEPRNVDGLVLRANALAGLKDLDAAIEQVNEAIKVDPSRGLSFTDLGALQLARGNRDVAESAFKHAVEVDPKSVPAHLALANYEWTINNRALAEQELKAALVLAPTDVTVNRALAYLYMATNRTADAEPPLKLVADTTNDPAARAVLAQYYQTTGRSAEAIRIFDTLAADPALLGFAVARKAAVLYAGGHHQEAYAAIDAALQKQGKNADLLLGKAQLLVADKSLDSALASAQAAAASGRTPAAQFLIGEIQATKGNWDAAIAAYLEALKLQSSYPRARVALAGAYLAANRPQDALHAAEDALAAQPNDLDAVLLKTRALIASGNAAGAEQVLRILPAQLLSQPRVQAQLGALAFLKGDVAGARSAYGQVLKARPDDVEALTALAGLDAHANNPTAARARIDSALAKEPKSVPLLLLAGRAHAATSDSAGAEAFFKRALETDPSNLDAYTLLGTLYMTERRVDEARAQFESLVTLKPSSIAARTMVGMLFELENRRDDARKEYEQILALNDRAAVAANNLAMIYLDTGGNVDVALQLAQTAKAQLTDMPQVNDTLGWAYYKKGLGQMAVTAFRQSVAKAPTDAGYLAHLGLAYAKTGESDKAREAFNKAFAQGRNFPDAAEARTAYDVLRKPAS